MMQQLPAHLGRQSVQERRRKLGCCRCALSDIFMESSSVGGRVRMAHSQASTSAGWERQRRSGSASKLSTSRHSRHTASARQLRAGGGAAAGGRGCFCSHSPTLLDAGMCGLLACWGCSLP